MYELTPEEQLVVQKAAGSPEVSEALRRVGEALQELDRRIYEALAAAFREIAEAFRTFIDTLLRSINPRSYRLYKRAKKARTRKKNNNRLMKELHRWIN